MKEITASASALPIHLANDSMPQDVLAIARETITIEINGLTTLMENLGENFIEAVETLVQTQGRVVVSGIGKSGHIARKIAATLSSTGTPAFFVHPSEASHGDLGMVSQGDTLIMLSNSGETDELLDLIIYAQRQNIPLISLTQRSESALARSSNVVLLLPKVVEACPMGLAPTTTTTMMLALGDALALALLNRKGFTAHDYKTLHPGGSLGRMLLHVRDLMHSGEALPLVPETMMMQEALVEMTKKTFGCVGVVNAQGGLVGVITDGDLRRHMSADFLTQRTTQVMGSSPKTIHEDALAIEAFEFMSDKKITCLFVTESLSKEDKTPKPIGILHIHDLLRAKIVG